MDEGREHAFRQMKHLLFTTIAAVVLVGCGKTQKSGTKIENQLGKPIAESSQSKLNADEVVSCCNSIHEAAAKGNIEGVKAHLAAGVDVKAEKAEKKQNKLAGLILKNYALKVIHPDMHFWL